jgi:hypothetical protein
MSHHQSRYVPQTPQFSRYITELTQLRCAPDVLASGYFPNAKEITESMSAYEVVRRHLWSAGFSPSDSSVLCVRGRWRNTAHWIPVRPAHIVGRAQCGPRNGSQGHQHTAADCTPQAH